VKHFASPKFWAAYEALPAQVRELAKASVASVARMSDRDMRVQEFSRHPLHSESAAKAMDAC